MSAIVLSYRNKWVRFNYWSRKNLFNTPRNSIITVVVLGLAGLGVALIIRYLLFEANWDLIAANRKLFFVGAYPSEEVWRVWVGVFATVTLAGLSYGIWVGRLIPYFAILGVLSVIFLTLGLGSSLEIVETPFSRTIGTGDNTVTIQGIDEDLVRTPGWAPYWLYSVSLGLALPFGLNWGLVAAIFALLGGTAIAGKYYLARWKESAILTQIIAAFWVLLVPAVLLLQIGVPTREWQGIFLDVIVFIVGVFASFFFGLLLALGRNSPFKAIQYVSIGYIEVIRAGPLIVWLLLATFLKDELGPVGAAFASLDLVFKVMIVFAFFGAAYIAEVVRGGLQSLSKGQHEAAETLGLSSTQKYVLIVLPQALKAVIPALVGRFIALWKDTALLAVLSLINTLEVGKKVLANTNLAGDTFFEVYIIVGLVYWVVSYALSRLGGTAESQLGVGERR